MEERERKCPSSFLHLFPSGRKELGDVKQKMLENNGR